MQITMGATPSRRRRSGRTWAATTAAPRARRGTATCSASRTTRTPTAVSGLAHLSMPSHAHVPLQTHTDFKVLRLTSAVFKKERKRAVVQSCGSLGYAQYPGGFDRLELFSMRNRSSVTAAVAARPAPCRSQQAEACVRHWDRADARVVFESPASCAVPLMLMTSVHLQAPGGLTTGAARGTSATTATGWRAPTASTAATRAPEAQVRTLSPITAPE